jgi:23S rRNA (uridine2479-2'-O)-methyltransferase
LSLPHTVRLHSANNDFQRLEVVRRNRQKRQQYGEFFLEGVRPINMALRHDWDIRAFVYSGDRTLSDWARNILHASTAETHFDIVSRLAEQLSGKSEPSELMAIVRTPPDDVARIKAATTPLVMVFDRPSSPGNLGSLVRSCDALGVDGLIVTGHGVDLYDPETISASRGSLFALPTVRLAGPQQVDEWLRSVRQNVADTQVVAMEEDAELDLWGVDFTGPTVLLMGNEKWGLSAGFKELATLKTRIPMSGSASSLNVAAAGSIALYEIRRQRTASPHASRATLH